MATGIFSAYVFSPVGIIKLSSQSLPNQNTVFVKTAPAVLAAQNSSLGGEIFINLPATFNAKTIVNGDTLLHGNASVSGKLTAPNIIYGLRAGQNITISGGQNPVISATLSGGFVNSFQGQTGNVQLIAGTGVSVTDLTIANTDPGSAQKIFKNISVGGSTITAGNNTDTLTLAAGSGISLSPDTGNNTITISSNTSSSSLPTNMTTNGVIYADSSSTITSLTPGTAGYVLQSNGAGSPPSWVANSSSNPAFSAITSGTNTQAAMIVGSGASLDFTGSGTINASTLTGATFAAPGPIGNTTANTGAFTSLTTSGLFTANNGLTVTSGATTFSAFGAGIVHTNSSGVISTSPVNLSGGAAEISNTLPVTNGGTGTNILPGNGQLLIGNGTNYTLATLTGTANQINVSNVAGSITLSTPQNIDTAATPTFSTLSLASNTNQLTFGSGNTGTISMDTLTTSRTYTFPDASGTVCLTSGNCSGSGSGLTGSGTTNFISKFTSSTGLSDSSLFDNGSIGLGTNSPLANTGLDIEVNGRGNAVLVANQKGSGPIFTASSSGTAKFEIANNGTIDLSGYGTGILHSDASGAITSAAVTLSTADVTGTLAIGNGGTGLATTPTNGQLLIGNGTNYSLTTLTQGSNIAITNGAGSISIATSLTPTFTTVNGLSLTANADGFSLNGGTTARTLTVTGADITLNGGGHTLTLGSDVSINQNLQTTSAPSFTSLNLTNNTNELILGTGNTGTVTLGSLTTARTYTLPDANGTVCLTSGNCAGAGNGITGSGTATQLAFFSGGTQNISSDSNLYFDNTSKLLGIGTNTPVSRLDVAGRVTGKALVSFNENGNQDIFTASASGATKFTIANNGNINATGAISGLTGLSSSGTIVFSTLASGVLHSTSGTISSSAINLAGGASEITGTLGIGNGGTGLASTPTNGQLLIGNGSGYTLATLTGTNNQVNVSNGSGSITLSLPQSIDTGATPTFSTLTLSAAANQLILGSGNTGTISSTGLTAARTYTLPDATGTLCLTTGNCAGAGGGVTTSGGTATQLAYFTGSQTIASDSNLFYNTTSKLLGIGTASPIGRLDVEGAVAGKALSVFNQTGDQNILVASSAGATKFVVANNGNLQFTGNTSFLNTLTSTATTAQTYTLPDASGTICLTTGNCAGSGGGITGAGVATQIAFFSNSSNIVSDSNLYWDNVNKLLGIGSSVPVAKLDLSGAVKGKALAIFNETGNQDIFTASASGATKFTIANNGNVTIAGNETIQGTTGTTYSGAGASIVFSDNSTHTISASSGTLQFGAATLTGLITGNNQNITGLTDLSASGIITFSGLNSAGIVHNSAAGVLSTSLVNLTGAADITGTLPIGNGGTNRTTLGSAGRIVYSDGTSYNFSTVGVAGQALISNGTGAPTWFSPTQGAVIFAGSSGILSQDSSSFSFDANNHLLGLGTNTPVSRLDVEGAIAGKALSLFNYTGTDQNIIVASNSGTTEFAVNANGSLQFTGGTSFLNTVNSAATQARTYTFPDADGTVCLTSGNCSGTGGSLTGSGTATQIAFFSTASNLVSDSNLYFDNTSKLLGLGTSSPVSRLDTQGHVTGKALVSFNETGDQNILTASASGTTRLTLDRSGNLNILGGDYQIGGTSVLSASTLGTNVINSSLTSVGALASGSIANGFGTILTTNTIQGSDITASGTTGFTSSGANAGLTFSNNSTHLISASSGTLQLGAFTLNGDITGNNKNVTGLSNLSASGTITFGGLNSTGIVHTNGSGVLSTSAVSLTADVSGILPIANGGTNANTIGSNGAIAYSNGSAYAFSGVGTSGQALVSGGAGTPTWFAPTAGSLIFAGTSGVLSQDNASLFYDSTNKLLGLGTATPISRLHVEGAIAGKALSIFNYTGSDQNILVASKSGTEKFAVANNGNLQFTGNTNFLNTLTTSATTAQTYTFPDTTGTVCLVEAGNCAGSGSGVTGSGNANRLAKFTGSQAVGNSSINDLFASGVALTIDASGNIGIGTTNPTAVLQVNGGNTGGNAAAIFNQTGASSNDIFAASASGNTKFTVSNNGNINFAGSTSVLNTLTSAATTARTYTLPDSSGTICLTTGNCAGAGSGITGSGTATQIAFFSGGSQNLSSDSNLFFDPTAKLLGIGTASPVSRLDTQGAVTGKALVSFNETGDQNILTASASGTTRLTLDRSGNLNIVGGVYQIGGASVLSSTTLGASVVNSSLTSVGNLNSGSIVSGFGSILTTNTIQGSDITASGTTGFTASGANAGLTFSNNSTHLISASAGTLQLGAFTLNGDITGNSKNVTGLSNLSAGGTITFGGLNSTGIVHTNGSGVLSTSLVDLANDVTGILPFSKGGTNNNSSYTAGSIVYSDGTKLTQDNTNLFYDATNKLIGIGTNTPVGKLDIEGKVTGKALAIFNETGDQSIFTASASGVPVFTLGRTGIITLNQASQINTGANTLTLNNGGSGAIQFFSSSNTIDSTGNLTLAGNTGITLTGNNNGLTFSTGAGTHTISASAGTLQIGAFTLTGDITGNSKNVTGLSNLSAGGTITFGGLNSTGIVHTNGSGVLSTSQVSLTADVSGILPIANGGTNTNTIGSNGAIVYANAGAYGFSAAGTSGQALISGGTGAPTWFAPTAGSILFAGTSGVLSQDNANFFFDNTNKLLGLGTATPVSRLDVEGAVAGKSLSIFNYTGSDQNIIVASKSGTEKFAVANNGNLQFTGNTNFLSTVTSAATSAQTYTLPDATGTICLTTGNCAGTGTGITGSGTATQLAFFSGGTQNISSDSNLFFDPTGKLLGIGTASPVSRLDTQGKVTGKALVAFNETGNQDIFTASASGTPVFTLGRTGIITLNQASQINTGASTLTLNNGGSGAIQFFSSSNNIDSNGNMTLAGNTGITLTGNNNGLTFSTGAGTHTISASAGTLQLGAFTLTGDITGNSKNVTGLANLSASGSITFSGLNTAGIVHNSAAGLLSTSLVNLTGATDVTGTLPVGNGGTGTATAFTQGSIVFAGASGVYSQNNNAFFWDNTNNRLGVGGNTNLAGTLDVRATSGTLAVASISGKTSLASLVVDNSGVGDLFTASSSGLNRFVIAQNGNVGIGTNLPGALLDVNGTAKATTLNATSVIQLGGANINTGGTLNNVDYLDTAQTISATKTFSSGSPLIFSNSAPIITLGSSNADATLTIKDSNGSPNTLLTLVDNGSAATLTVDTINAGSALKTNNTTRIDNNGNITAGTITSSGYAGANAILYAAPTTGLFSTTTTTTQNQCLLSGNGASGTPTWGTCALGTNYWQLNGSTLSPATISNTLSIGTTGSLATFDVRNLNGTQATASISGKTSFAALTVDNSGIGDIFSASASGATRFTIGQTGAITATAYGTGIAHFSSTGLITSSAINLAGSSSEITGQLGVSNGGTGASSFTTNGILFGNNTGAIGVTAQGAAGTVLHGNGGVPTFAAVSLTADVGSSILPLANGGTNANLTADNGGIVWSNGSALQIFAHNANSGLALVSGGAGTPSWFAPTQGSIIFAGANGALSQSNANLFWDNSTNRLGIGTATPGSLLDIQGSGGVLGTTPKDLFRLENTDANAVNNAATQSFFAKRSGDVLTPVASISGLITNVGAGTYTGALSFSTAGTAAVPTERMRIDSSGNLNLITGAYQINGSSIIDSSKNLLNINTVTTSLNPGAANSYNLGTGTGNQYNTIYGNQLFQNGNAVCDSTGANCPTGGTAWTLSSPNLYPTASINRVGIGTTTTANMISQLYVTRTLSDGALGKALALFNQTENQDILSASASGTTKFTVSNAGVLTLAGGNTNDILSNGATTLAIDAGGAAALNIGRTNANALNFGAGSAATRFFNTGTFSIDSTNLQLGNGSASIIQTTGSGTDLSLRSAGTGNINLGQNVGNGTVVVQPNAGGQASLIVKNQGVGDLFTASAGATPRFVITNAGNVGIGSSLPSFPLEIDGTNVGAASNLLTLRNTDNSVNAAAVLRFTLSGTATSATNAQIAGIRTGTTPGTTALTFSTSDGTTVTEKMRLDTNGNIGINTQSSAALLDVRGVNGTNPISGIIPVASLSGQTSFAGLVVDNRGVGDLFTASSAGLTKFAINNNGNLQFTGNSSFLNTFTTSGLTAAHTYTLPDATGTICLSTNNCGFATGTNYFQRNTDAGSGLNVIAPATIADTLAIGVTNPLDYSGLEVDQNGKGNSIGVFNQLGAGPILTASSSGAPRFAILNDGSLNVGIGNVNSGGAITTDTGLQLNGSLRLTDAFSASATYIVPQAGLLTLFDGSHNAELDIQNSNGSTKLQLTNDASAGYINEPTLPLLLQNGGGSVAIGNVTPLASTGLHISKNSKGNASLVVDNTGGAGDIFTASASGTPVFTLGRTGIITLNQASQINTGANTLTLNNGGAGTIQFFSSSNTIDQNGNLTLAGDITINGGDLVSPSSTFNLANAATTLNLGSTNVTRAINIGTGTNADTINIGTGGTTADTITIGASGLTGTNNGSMLNLPGGFLASGAVTGKAFAILNETGNQNILVASASGTNVFTLDRSGNITASSPTANADAIKIQPNATGANTFAGTLTSADLTGARTWTLPDATGTICVSGQSCALTGTVTSSGTGLAGRVSYFTTDSNLTGDANYFWDTTNQRLGIGVGSSLLGTLDLRATSGTLPIATISGKTSFAGLVVDNSGRGDLFAASSSGLNRFVITQNGNVGVGTALPARFMDVVLNANTWDNTLGGQFRISSNDSAATAITLNNTDTGGVAYSLGSGGTGNYGGAGSFSIYQNVGAANAQGLRMLIDSSGNFGINAQTLAAVLDVRGVGNKNLSGIIPIASFSGKTSFAGLVVDNSGRGDLFAASSSGLTKFAINNNGNLQFTGNSTFLNTFTTSGLTAARTYTLPDATGTICVSGQSCALTGTVTSSGTGLAGRVSYFTTDSNLTGDANYFWDTTNQRLGIGVGSSLLGTLDLRATSGTLPIATISGKTSKAAIIIDNSGVGDLFTASSSGLNRFVITQNGNVGIGTALPTAPLQIGSDVPNTTTPGFVLGSGANVNNFFSFSGGRSMFGYDASAFSNNGALALSSGNSKGFEILTGGTNGTFLSGTASVVVNPSGNVGIGTTLPIGALDVRANLGTVGIASISGATSFAGLVTDNAGRGDLFTASSAGLTKFVINNNGNLQLSANSTFLNTLTATTLTAARTYTLPDATGTICLSTGNCPSSSPWTTFSNNSNTVINPSPLTDALSIGNAGTGSYLPFTSLYVEPAFNSKGNALVALNQTGNGDIFTASASGVSRFSISASGNITVGGNSGFANAIANFGGSVNSSLQVNNQNRSNAGSASSDYVATADDGTDTTNYIDMGINSSGYNDSSYTIGSAHDGYLYTNGGNLTLGTQTAGKAIIFHTGGTLAADEAMRIDGNGNIGINTTSPTALLDIRGIGINNLGGTIPVASISGRTSFASLVVNNSGTGDLITASSSGLNRFVINQNGNVGVGTTIANARLDVEGGNIMIGQQTNTGQSSEQNWTKVSQNTAGTIGAPPNANTSIASISASVVYNGSLYVGTYGSATGSAEIYRYNGSGQSWTRVSHPTSSGVIGLTAGTPGIASISAMTVYNGSLYVGTSKINGAEVYRYDGGTNWTRVSNAAGTITAAGTGNIDGVTSMTVYQGKLYIGTSEPAKAEIYYYSGGTVWTQINSSNTAGTPCATGAALEDTVTAMSVADDRIFAAISRGPAQADLCVSTQGQAFTELTSTLGTFPSITTNITGATAITSMVSYNGKLYMAIRTAGAANLLRLETANGFTGSAYRVTRINSANGTVAPGGTSSIDSVSSLAVYNGRLYVGTEKKNAAEIYRYESGEEANSTWTKVSQATAGTIAAGGTANIDMVSNLIAYNGSLYAGTFEPGSAEIYSYTTVSDQSYSLQFHAGAFEAGGEQNSLLNTGSISFIASSSAYTSAGSNNTGAFLFDHSIITNTGAYDYAEDYGTRDEGLAAGDIVGLDANESQMIVKATDSANMIGIYSSQPGFELGQKDATINGGKAVPIALTGRVPVKVSTESGTIKIGDMLTVSSTPGVAMKATQPGFVIGRAMENYDGTGQDGNTSGTVMTFVNNTWYDPGIKISSSGNLNVNGDSLSDTPLQLPVDTNANSTANGTNPTTLLSLKQLTNNLTTLTSTVSAIQSQTASMSAQIEALNAKFADLQSLIPSIASGTASQLSTFNSQLTTSDATYSGTLSVLGRTLLSDVGITGRLTDGILSINGLDDDGNASINTVGGDLKLQDAGVGGIDILAGTIKIDTLGNIKSKAAITAKVVTTAKLNIAIDNQASGSSVLSSSAGSIVIKAGVTSIEINTTALTKKSLIFATPDQPVTIGAKAIDKDTFIIKLQQPQDADIKVNWWIVN